MAQRFGRQPQEKATPQTGREPQQGAPLRLGVVDNDPMALHMLERNLGAFGAPIMLLWTASDAADALDRCANAADRPDLVLTDIQMPGMDGHELARRLHAAFPRIVVVGITAFAADLTAGGDDGAATGPADAATPASADAARSPFAAVLDKIMPTQDLLAELARLSGNAAMLAWLAGAGAARPLSEQELEVMRRYADGMTNEAIAHRMHVGVTTVKTYARRAFEKLGTHSRTEAVIACLRRGLI